jgi:hypothetical protein
MSTKEDVKKEEREGGGEVDREGTC